MREQVMTLSMTPYPLYWGEISCLHISLTEVNGTLTTLSVNLYQDAFSAPPDLNQSL